MIEYRCEYVWIHRFFGKTVGWRKILTVSSENKYLFHFIHFWLYYMLGFGYVVSDSKESG